MSEAEAPTAPVSTALSIKQILEAIPHRYPFLLVDKILEMDTVAGTIVGQKNVTINEEFFQGHFPEVPIMPGVLIVEALAQCSAILARKMREGIRIGVFLNINKMKFRRPVFPGDTLIFNCKALHLTNKAGKMDVKALVEGKVAAEGEITFAFVDGKDIK